jgi:hypothetical protein
MLKKSKGDASDSAALASNAPSPQQALRAPTPAEQDFSYDDDDGELEIDSAEDTARYIADMIASLAYIAREARLDLLTYLLDMARVEAEMQARQSETPLDDD